MKDETNKIVNWIEIGYTRLNYKEELSLVDYIKQLQQENQKYKETIDKAIEYMKDFIFEPLLTNEDRKLIMYNDNLRNFEKILKEVK